MTIDLDTLKTARREALGEAPTVIFGGETFTLPVEMPFEVPESLAEVAVAAEAGDSLAITRGTARSLKALMGDQYDAFMAHRPSMDDIQELITRVMADYGMADVGEPPASG